MRTVLTLLVSLILAIIGIRFSKLHRTNDTLFYRVFVNTTHANHLASLIRDYDYKSLIEFIIIFVAPCILLVALMITMFIKLN